MSAPRPLVHKNLKPKCKFNKNIHVSQWEIWPYNNNEWKNKYWMELTHLLSNFPLNLRSSCTSTFTSKQKKKAFLDVHTREITSPLNILYKVMPQIIPLLTLTLVRKWHEESIPRDDTYHEGCSNNMSLPTVCRSYFISIGPHLTKRRLIDRN